MKNAMPVTVASIREKFPDPVVYQPEEDQPGQYDVAGAFVMFVTGIELADADGETRFASEEELGPAMRSANPVWTSFPATVDDDFATVVAIRLIQLSDDGHIEGAWNYVEKILNWDGKDRAVFNIEDS